MAMKEYTTDKLRNVALVGHQSSGKTSLVEAMLFNAGAISRMGRIEDGTTVSDWEEEEKARKLSLSTSLIQLEFADHKINVLDTPGYTDFLGEMKNAIRVADSVIVVVDAVSGVEVGTELVWEYAREYQQPIIVVINKMDRENASYKGALEQLRVAFPKYKFVPVTMPIGQQASFKGVANTVTRKAYMGVGSERSELPADMVDEVEAAHLVVMEAAAEADDDLMQKYFDEGTLSYEDIRDGMRKAARSHLLNTVPVFATSGTQNIGVVPLMEALIVYTSSPEVRRVGILRPGAEKREYLMPPQKDDAPLAAYVFKTATDRYVGQMSYFRIFSGVISSDSRNYNNSSRQEERFGTVMEMRGKEQIPAPRLHVGDLGVVAKLQATKTGDTIGDKDKDFEIVRPEFPQPIYSVAVTPRTQADSAKIGTVLTSLCAADPTLRWRQDPETKQVILEGMGEIHIAVTIARAEALGVGIDTHLPRVPYRETITTTKEATYRHKKQTGGAGQFGEVSLRIMPHEGDFVFESQIVGGAVSAPFVASTEKGVRGVLENGVLAGYPIVNVKAIIFDGKEHPVDSKDIAFQIAGREAFKEAFMAANPTLLEPIMNVQITVPETMMGDVMGDLNTRRGRIMGMDTVGLKSVISAQVPLAEMLRYSNQLRSMTGGRGIYTMTFSHYERVPQHLQADIIAQNKAEATG
ncbi:MAG: elongation factor G [Anaerolineae bacterium]|nr:elongation factor G [Anaerolineae bacterium]MDW8171153.1 elongation factor G [Anaerolineae bacterium]